MSGLLPHEPEDTAPEDADLDRARLGDDMAFTRLVEPLGPSSDRAVLDGNAPLTDAAWLGPGRRRRPRGRPGRPGSALRAA